MAKSKDPLAMMPAPVRAKVIKSVAMNMLGPVAGAGFVKQMDAAQNWKGRQLGDATEPEKNYWKGAWRIYEIE